MFVPKHLGYVSLKRLRMLQSGQIHHLTLVQAVAYRTCPANISKIHRLKTDLYL